nr:coiled-coil domain-containing protein 77-like [Parasteatoda tepidariorum]
MNLRDADKPKSADKAFFRTIDFDGNETAVKKVPFRQTSPRRPEGPFECMFCRQGSDHKQCVEKIGELNATIRKLKVEIKTSEKDAKNEKKVALANKEGAEKAYLELESEKQCAKGTIAALESKNASLLEELKMLRNRLKNMERYRRCEIEGLQTDIKNLKTKIKDLEKQLTRAVLIFENGQKDMELLKTVHTTAQQSKSTVVAIKRLKAQLYGIETDIKRL